MPPYGGVAEEEYSVTDAQLSAIGLAVATLNAKADDHTASFLDILLAFANFSAGQARIMELLDMVHRQLVELNRAVAQEPDGENLGDLLRTIVIQLQAIIPKLKDMPAEVANVLHSEGLTADQPP